MFCLVLTILLFSFSNSVIAENFETDSLNNSKKITKTKKNTAELPEIRVTAERWRDIISQPLLESSGLKTSLSKVTSKQIENQNAETVVEALKYVPGMLDESRGKKVKNFVSFRGQKYPYPNYAVEGAWQREFLELPYFFATPDIEKIEITRSSAALISSLTGLSGVVNIILKKYDEPTTNFGTEYGSFESYKAFISHGNSTESEIGPIKYSLGLNTRHTEGPENKFASENMSNYYAYLGLNPVEKLTLDIRLFHLYGKREMTKYIDPNTDKPDSISDWYSDPIFATFFNFKSHYQFSKKASLELIAYYTHRNTAFNRIYYADGPVEYIEPDLDTASKSDVDLVSYSTDVDWEWGINVTQSLNFIKGNILRIGGLYNNWTAPNGKRYYTGVPYETQTLSFVAVDEQRIGKFSFDVGTRWAKTYNNSYGLKKEAYDNDLSDKGFPKISTIEDEWDPSVINTNAGGSYFINEFLSVNLNGAFGQIKPKEGVLDINYKKPENENRFKVDFGLSFEKNVIGNGSITGFYILRDNGLFISSKTDTLDDGSIVSLYKNENRNERGFELDLRSARFFNTGSIFFNMLYMKYYSTDNNNELNDLPGLIMSGGILLEKFNGELNFFAKYVGEYENNRFSPDGSNYPLGDYVELDLKAGYYIDKSKKYKVYAGIKNITDEKFSTCIGYPDFGRRFYCGFQCSIK